MRTIHRQWGEVTITARFSSHYNIMTGQGVKQCHPSELQELPEIGGSLASSQSTDPVPLEPEIKQPDLFYINTATPTELYKRFTQIGKFKSKQITERSPFTSAEDMKEKCQHLFDSPQIIETLSAQMRFDFPGNNSGLPSPAADAPTS